VHRKILLILSTHVEAKKQEKGKKERLSSKVFARKPVNKNPNCNHNSNSIFYNHSFSNIKYDDHQSKPPEEGYKDLLWANGEQYSEKDEIKWLKELILRLFHEPHFGEKRDSPPLKNLDQVSVNELYSEFEKYFGHEEILIDGYRINKYSLWTIKKLNPHHKTLLYTLIDLNKLPTRSLTQEILMECISHNNKWNKDCYFWVLTYMVVQTIKTQFDIGTKGNHLSNCRFNTYHPKIGRVSRTANQKHFNKIPLPRQRGNSQGKTESGEKASGGQDHPRGQSEGS
jgi:hypothetical protein